MDQTLEQQIRLADSFAKRYFAALSRLRYLSNGDTAALLPGESRESMIQEAASTVANFLAATETARTSALTLGHDLGTASVEPFDSPVNDEERQQIALEAAIKARAELRGLQSCFPGVDWSDSLGGVDTDLFSSKKKNLLIATVSIFTICGTLAIFYPVEAAVIGMLALGVLGKAYMVQRKYLR